MPVSAWAIAVLGATPGGLVKYICINKPADDKSK